MMHDIESERHARKLLPRNVGQHEMKIPAPKACVLPVMIVGIMDAAWLRVVFAMLGFEPLK